MPDRKKNVISSSKGETDKKKTDNAVLIAVVSALATLAVAIFGFPPLADWYRSRLPPTPIFIASPTVTVTAVSVLKSAPPTNEPATPGPVASVISPTQVMWVKVDLDVQPRYDGKAPFRVTVNLQRSNFMLADGKVVFCRDVTTCGYSWTISRDGVFLDSFKNSEGILVYTFTSYGTYIVSAQACQEDVCSEAKQAEIIVK